MSPMLWTILFLMFILLFMFFNILNYFHFNPIFKSTETTKNMDKENKTNFLTWKW
uniref:ATP synthase F0 subunit 8 n=1 Tax=Einfeldia sp. TaxID=2995616 RepID=A0A9E8MCR7_9DIPT|nr:ATP synthase F0 subunit 8 [Einfeldia sp.]